MKVDITCILRDQWRTMGGSAFGWISDISFFLLVPLLLALLTVRSGVVFLNEVYGYALTVFSIFSALLITAQIAIFGIFQKSVDKLQEKTETERSSIRGTREKQVSVRRTKNLKELNSNISYLTLLSCIAASVVLTFLAFNLASGLETFVSVFLYGHFATSLAMALKRFHIAFEDEYKE